MKHYNYSEAEIKRQVKDFLAIKGIFNFPLTQGMASYRGLPDRVMHLKDKDGSRARVVYLEIKREGGKLSEHQLAFKEQCLRDGIDYFVVQKLEDLLEIIEEVKD